MEGDDISTRIAQDDFPKTILVAPKPIASRPIDRVDWSKVLEPAPPLPRLSWSTRMRARIETASWVTVIAIGFSVGCVVGTIARWLWR